MIYTVGNKKEYDSGIAEKAAKGERFLKDGVSARGRQKSLGGAVWATKEGAEAWRLGEHTKHLLASRDKEKTDEERKLAEEHMRAISGLTIYGIEGEWERDTMQHDGESFARLVIPRPLVRLDAEFTALQKGKA